jgi:ribosomal protein S17
MSKKEDRTSVQLTTYSKTTGRIIAVSSPLPIENAERIAVNTGQIVDIIEQVTR